MAVLQQRSRSGQGPSARFILLLIACALQVALAPQLSLLGGRFNFMAAAACALAPGLPAGTAAVTGFACGLFFDLTAPVPVGLMALLLSIACFALAGSSSGLSLGLSAEGVRLTAAAVLALTMAYALVLLALGIETDIVSALLGHGLATAALTTLAALPFLPAAAGGEAGRGFSVKASAPRGQRYKVPR